MSNEVNIDQVAYGTIDPGIVMEFYEPGNYDQLRVKARFFTVAPDPFIPLGDGITIEIRPEVLNLEVTRNWSTVWVGRDGSLTFQRNATIENIGNATSAYHLLRAETDN